MSTLEPTEAEPIRSERSSSFLPYAPQINRADDGWSSTPSCGTCLLLYASPESRSIPLNLYLRRN